MTDSWAMFVALLVVGAGIAIASVYFPELSKEVVIGIDLGTTYSVVAVCVGGIVNVIEDPASGSGLLPSYVSFPPTPFGAKPLVGQVAKDVANQFPEDTLFDIKRIIGRKFSDPVVQEEIRNFPFTVGPSNHKIPLPIVTVRKSTKPLQLYPTNISSFVLGKLKKQIEDYFFWRQLMGWKIRAATISVPANFDVDQQVRTFFFLSFVLPFDFPKKRSEKSAKERAREKEKNVSMISWRPSRQHVKQASTMCN